MSKQESNRKKSASWREEEVLFLLEQVVTHYNVINGQFSSGVTTEGKRKAWDEISLALKAQGFER